MDYWEQAYYWGASLAEGFDKEDANVREVIEAMQDFWSQVGRKEPDADLGYAQEEIFPILSYVKERIPDYCEVDMAIDWTLEHGLWDMVNNVTYESILSNNLLVGCSAASKDCPEHEEVLDKCWSLMQAALLLYDDTINFYKKHYTSENNSVGALLRCKATAEECEDIKPVGRSIKWKRIMELSAKYNLPGIIKDVLKLQLSRCKDALGLEYEIDNACAEMIKQIDYCVSKANELAAQVKA